MALVLGMNLEKDNEIWIEDLLITIDKILNPKQTQITVHGKYMTQQLVINDLRYIPVTTDVKMMLGTDTNRDGFCRVLVDAPRHISIDRGQKKNQE
jgi:hypothetical protein